MRVIERLDSQVTTEPRRSRKLSAALKNGAVIVQAVAAIALVGQQNSEWRLLTLAALSLGIVVLVLPAVKERGRRWLESVKDRRVADRDYPRFTELVHQFGRFVDTRTSDTLHYIIDQELSEPLRAKFRGQLGTPTIHLWHDFWYFFSQRLERQPKVLAELTQSIPEFRHIVSAYHNLCVAPIFERLPQELRAELTDRDRSRLNGFQQRYALFIEQYEAFVKRFSESRPALEDSRHFLQRSNPI